MFEAWSVSALADCHSPGVAGLGGTSQPLRFPPTVYAAADGTLWLADVHGTVIRQTSAGWQRVAMPGIGVVGLAPQAEGGAVVLARRDERFELFAVDRSGHTRWARPADGLAALPVRPGRSVLRLLHDEIGSPYLHVKAPSPSVYRIDASDGNLAIAEDLKRYDADVLIRQGAVWRIQFDGTHRLWVRRRFGADDDVIARGGVLDDTFLTAVAVAPDGAPVLTDGRRLLTMTTDGAERLLPLPALPPATPPLPAVLDLLRPAAAGDALWVVYADGGGWGVYPLPLG